MRTKARLATGLVAALPGACCAASTPGLEDGGGGGGSEPAARAMPEREGAASAAARAMVDEQLRARDIVDERVLAAMGAVPRHAFVPPSEVDLAYDDRPLPIGWGVTISQPYIVALMTQLADARAGERVLDVGTGSGYQAAVLAALGAKVYGIEIIEPLAEQAGERLARLGYAVDVVHGDGWQGRPEHAPYDAIIVAAAPPVVPDALMDQLAIGGRLVVPVGEAGGMQGLTVVTRTESGFTRELVAPVAFVPLVGGPS